MRFKLTITVILLGLSANNIFAETISTREAKEILLKAQKLQKTRTYTAESISGKSIIKIYQRLNRDGTTYRRIEAKFKNKISLSLVNENGYFQISGYSPNIAIKYDFDRNSSKLNFGNNANYKGENGLCDNIPCYIITQ